MLLFFTNSCCCKLKHSWWFSYFTSLQLFYYCSLIFIFLQFKQEKFHCFFQLEMVHLVPFGCFVKIRNVLFDVFNCSSLNFLILPTLPFVFIFSLSLKTFGFCLTEVWSTLVKFFSHLSAFSFPLNNHQHWNPYNVNYYPLQTVPYCTTEQIKV